MRIYLPEKVIFTFKGRKTLCLPKLKSITVLLYEFSTMNGNFSTFTFVVEVRGLSQKVVDILCYKKTIQCIAIEFYL